MTSLGVWGHPEPRCAAPWALMIRDRLPRDLGPLVDVLRLLEHPGPGWSDARRRSWLTAGPPDVAWVFDQAPVSVTPTDNVAGQVRLRRPARTSSGDDPWLLDQLVVRPGDHEVGIARFLLREAVRHVTDRDGRLVVDVDSCRLSSTDPMSLLERRGFIRPDGSAYALGPLAPPDRSADK